MNNLTITLRWIALGAIVVLIATLPFRKKNLDKKLGECRLVLTRKNSMMFLAVLLFAPLMIILQWIRDFAPYIDIILSVTAVLGVEVVLREHVFNARSGVYDNALIVDGRKIEKSNIVAFPTLEYENDPDATDENNPSLTDPNYKRALKIVTNKSGVIFVGFDNEDERNKAVEILKKWVE